MGEPETGCVECETVATGDARGWRIGLTIDDEMPRFALMRRRGVLRLAGRHFQSAPVAPGWAYLCFDRLGSSVSSPGIIRTKRTATKLSMLSGLG